MVTAARRYPAGTVGLVLWTAMLAATVVLGVYHVLWFLFILGYLLAANDLRAIAAGSGALRRVLAWPGWARLAAVVLAALALRWLMLLQQGIVTADIETYVMRAQHMLDGELPYRDFTGGSKPPSYQYLVWLMGTMVGPDVWRFRLLFSAADALVAGSVYLLCRHRSDPAHALHMAALYAMCPVSLVTIGLDGHCEGVVGLFAAGAFVAFQRRRLDVSALLLGVACSLKVYPVVMLPFLAVSASRARTSSPREVAGPVRWLPTVRYGTLFALPTLASMVPLAMLDPLALRAYFREGAAFKGWGSFTAFAREAAGVTDVAGVPLAWVVMAVFGGLLVLLFVDWYRRGPAGLRRWTRLLIVVLAVHYGFYIALAFPYYEPPHWQVLTAVFLASWGLAMAVALPRLLPRLSLGGDEELSDDRSGLALAMTVALLLFILGLPTLTTWYFLWPLPFLLAVGPGEVRTALLWITLWHTIGMGMALLPGLAPVN